MLFFTKKNLINITKKTSEIGIANKNIYGKHRYIFSRYEDLVTSNSKTLKIVAEFLEIDESKFTNAPTFCGLPWVGNNFDKQQFDNVTSAQVGRWKERIDDHEAALIEFHFRDLMHYFDYEIEYSDAQQAEAASNHYKWLNYASDRKADFSLADKISF